MEDALAVAVDSGDAVRQPAARTRPTRVLLVAESAAAASALSRLLESHDSTQIVGQVRTITDVSSAIAELAPDVVLWHVAAIDVAHDEKLFVHQSRFVVVIEHLEARWVRHLLAGRVHALLVGNPGGPELLAAIQGAAEGLVAISPVLTSLLRPGTAIADSADYPEHLTAREQEILEMMMEGLSNKEIALCLNVSTHTVKFHISSVLGKLGASSRTEAITIGLRRGLITI